MSKFYTDTLEGLVEGTIETNPFVKGFKVTKELFGETCIF